jgi:hypothetical protein
MKTVVDSKTLLSVRGRELVSRSWLWISSPYSSTILEANINNANLRDCLTDSVIVRPFACANARSPTFVFYEKLVW